VSVKPYTLGHADTGWGALNVSWYGTHGTSPEGDIERVLSITEATHTDRIRMLLCEAGYHEHAFMAHANSIGAPMVGSLIVWSIIQCGWDHPATVAVFKACEVMYAGTELWDTDRNAESMAREFFVILSDDRCGAPRDALIQHACRVHADKLGGELIPGGYVPGSPVLPGIDFSPDDL